MLFLVVCSKSLHCRSIIRLENWLFGGFVGYKSTVLFHEWLYRQGWEGWLTSRWFSNNICCLVYSTMCYDVLHCFIDSYSTACNSWFFLIFLTLQKMVKSIVKSRKIVLLDYYDKSHKLDYIWHVTILDDP